MFDEKRAVVCDPGRHKWHRDLAIAEVLVETLRPLKAGWMKSLKAKGEAELKAIRDARAAGSAKSPEQS